MENMGLVPVLEIVWRRHPNAEDRLLQPLTETLCDRAGLLRRFKVRRA